MKRVRSGHEEDDMEEEEPRDARSLGVQVSERRWRDIPRNAKLTEAETLTFFSEFKRAGDLTDEDVIERCIFLVQHAPPNSYLSLQIKGKLVQLIKRLEKVDAREHCLSRDDCLQPSGVVWKTGEEIEAAGRDCFPEDVMICTIDKDLFKLWPLLSFMQGIGTLHQVDGRAIDLGRKIMHLLDELGKKYPALAKLLDPPTVIFNLQAMSVNPSAVVIPAGLAPGNVPAFPGAIGIWTCPSELRAGELIGHLRATLAPILLPGVVAQFHYLNAPMQNL
ncbi:uncharacterized protein PITG_21944 [Phytophthora infestans T30-4]|uniref:Uncharacterized protein n=1 Tax=Phytophthora infestans (strain T30-4) TaxID=403677 RepID=D0RLS1_PHYIT|nr:uncharacterized protein PITG_21944 [Phytophthora infestans T30-4]EEY67974.1 conserved hypothetical protein [Phytophthora infestans T30-4]|eukprot:XP_002999339.1 conserved hypothetical protein [Phytophthora infestans T30-4]